MGQKMRPLAAMSLQIGCAFFVAGACTRDRAHRPNKKKRGNPQDEEQSARFFLSFQCPFPLWPPCRKVFLEKHQKKMARCLCCDVCNSDALMRMLANNANILC
nr:hypothetical protein [Pandoravirus massiliensis]